MHLPERKVSKLETQLRCDVRVRLLLVRQGDIQSNRFRTDVGGSTIGRFHDSGTATCHNDKVALTVDLADTRHQSTKFASLVVVSRESHVPVGHRNGSTVSWITGMLGKFCFGFG